MYEKVLNYLFPTLILLSCVSFVWAWVVTAVKAPKGSEETRIPDTLRQDWKYLEAVALEGARTSIAKGVGHGAPIKSEQY
jgi:hypothetical protein